MYRDENGFSILEVMIAVAIITILMSIAFPSYRIFSRRARSSEAVFHTNVIRTYQITYRSTNDTFLELPKNPPGDVPSIYMPWGNPGGNWDKLGFRSDKNIRYQYGAEPGDTGNIASSFKITAQTDFDAKGEPYDTWELTNKGELTHTNRYK